MFGKEAANKRRVFICMLDEDEILRMPNGDADLKETIQDHQRVWKRHALHGESSSFVIVVNSRSIAKSSLVLNSKNFRAL